MSRLTRPALVALLFCPPLAAQDDKLPNWAQKFFSGKDAPPPPVILHDFGTVPKGTVRDYSFRMTNIYAVPMQVEPIQPACRWVSVVKYTAQMDPLETGQIDVRLETAGIEGPKQVEFKVRFKGQDPTTKREFSRDARLVILADSRLDIAIDPGAITFGPVPAGRAMAKSVQVTYTGKQAGWAVKGAECNKDLFTVTTEKVPAAATTYKVTATLKEQAPPGVFNEPIVLKTNDPTAPSLTLSATGTVHPPLMLLGLSPTNKLRLPPVGVGKEHKQVVSVIAEKPFKVTAVDGQGDGLSVVIVPSRRAKSEGLILVFEPEKVGPVRKVLTIKTDTGESVSLTVEATATER
ncbi:MAG TPA: DUF1573 domain-containing protein [Gemmataceae bacterium]|nr:DUF1573 domain-containing protein [Gemmataceae bacterium]